MKILVVTQYFWPETFRINDLVNGLVERGHEVAILTGKPNYPAGDLYDEFRADPAAFSRYRGCDVIRAPMMARGRRSLTLLLNYFTFALMASIIGPWRLRGREFDAIFVFEPSPISVGFPAIVLRFLKKAPLAFWVLDLWPQSLEATGVVRSPFVLRQVGRVVSFIYDRCDLILAQSRSFVGEIVRFDQPQEKVVYFPSWADKVSPAAGAPPCPIPDDPERFTIVFTGNIGEAQDFPTVLDAAEQLQEYAVRWVIIGDGRMAGWVRAEVDRRGLSDIVLLPGRFPLEQMPAFYAKADALLVSLKAEPIFAMTLPGKLQSYIAEGLPILAVLAGEGAEVVIRSSCGLASPPGDASALAAAVRQMLEMPLDERKEMGQNGLRLSQTEFDRDMRVDQLVTLLKSLTWHG